jgi:putative endonuclease
VNAYYVYMMTNRSRVVLYTGVTNDLILRFWGHRAGAIEGFTKKYRLTTLVHDEIYNDVLQAIQHEKQIEGWRRSRKNALVETLNPWWHDLSARLDSQREVPRRPSAARDDKSEVAGACDDRSNVARTRDDLPGEAVPEEPPEERCEAPRHLQAIPNQAQP